MMDQSQLSRSKRRRQKRKLKEDLDGSRVYRELSDVEGSPSRSNKGGQAQKQKKEKAQGSKKQPVKNASPSPPRKKK